MRHGIRLSNKLYVLMFVLASLFVFSACEGEGIQITRITPTVAPNATATSPANPSDTPVLGAPTSTPDPAVAVPTPLPRTTPTPPPATSTPAPTPTPVPPIASFEVDVRSGIAPFSVLFTDTTDGPVSEYEWDFGDGTTSDEAAPVHEYTKAGTHTVRLTVSGLNGTDNEVRSSYITVSPGEIVGLSIRPEHPTVAVTKTVKFEALAVDQFGNGVPVDAEWSLDTEDGMLGDNGLFTAGTTAQTLTAAVSASARTDTGANVASASVTITSGPLTTVELSDPNLTLTVQDTHQFSFTATDDFGNEITDAIARWSVESGAGSIDGTGLFGSGTRAGFFEDSVHLNVASGNQTFEGHVTVLLEPDVLDKVIVTPNSTEVIWQHNEQFAAAGEDQFGNPIDELAFLWDATGGAITSGGIFTAGTQVGVFTISASAVHGSTRSGSASVTIPPPEFFFQNQFLGSDPTTVMAPIGIDFGPEGNLFVGDQLNDRIIKYGPDGTLLTDWDGSEGAGGKFRAIEVVAVDGAGNVYTFDGVRHTIQRFNQNGEFLLEWGSEGNGPGQFLTVTGIDVDQSGNVYVPDRDTHRVQKFSPTGELLLSIGSFGSGAGELNRPTDVAIGPAGDIFILERNNSRVSKFNIGGSFIKSWGSPGTSNSQFQNPLGITADLGGNVYVSEINGANRIQVFSQDGIFLKSWGSVGIGSGEFSTPRGIAVDDAGDVFVADHGNNRIQRFTSGGGFKDKWGQETLGGVLSLPLSSALDSQGNIYVVDAGDVVQKFDSSGSFILSWGGSGQGQGEFDSISMITIDAQDNVYVSDTRNDRVQKFDRFGRFLRSFINVEDPRGIAIDKNNNLYVNDTVRRVVVVFNENGNIVRSFGGIEAGEGQIVAAEGLAVDEFGNVFVEDKGGNRILKFRSSGQFVKTWGSVGTESGQFLGTENVAVDQMGNVYVVDRGNFRIQVFTNDGAFLAEWGTEGGDPGEFAQIQDIDFGEDGFVYVTDTSNRKVHVFRSPALTRP